MEKIPNARYSLFPKAIQDSLIAKETSISKKRINSTPKFLATLKKLELLTKAGDEKVVSLNLKKREAKREKFNAEILAIENQLQAANNLPTFKSIKELQKYQEEKNDDIFSKEERPADVFLTETANILNDLRYLHASAGTELNNVANKQNHELMTP